MAYLLATNQMNEQFTPKQIKKVIPAHVDWVRSGLNSGLLVQSGKWGDTGGMCIIEADNMNEAEGILLSDPLIKLKPVSYRLDPFYPDIAFNDESH